MSIKKLFIFALIVAAAFYVFKVKGFNPFSTKIKGETTLYQLNGDIKPLSELAGENGTLIFLMGTWCPYCVEEVGHLKQLTDFFRLHKINVLFGIYGRTIDETTSWAYKQDLPWDWKTFYWEERFEEEFHIKKFAVPYLTAVNKKGEIIYSKGATLYTDGLSKICNDLLKSNN